MKHLSNAVIFLGMMHYCLHATTMRPSYESGVFIIILGLTYCGALLFINYGGDK